jgi:hypothetical protein
MTDIAKMMGLDAVLFEGLEHRSRVPLMLRDLVQRGAVEVTLTMSAKTALRMAADIERAVIDYPLGVPPLTGFDGEKVE